MLLKALKNTFIRLLVCVLCGGSIQAQTDVPVLGLGERANWLRGSWGVLWLPETCYNGNIEGISIESFLAQISHLRTIDYVQIGLTNPSIYSPVHTAPHGILESLWQGDTDANGKPLNLVVPRVSMPDPFLSWLKALKAAGLKTEVYVNSYNLLARDEASIPSGFPALSARWKTYCDTNATVQAFINSKSYHTSGTDPRRPYMFCYAEFILKEYAVRYGDLVDAWCFDSADNIMEACGDDADNGVLDDQRIYEAFANAVHAGNPNAAVAFNNSVGTDAAPFATPTLFDDYTFGHPFGGAGNMASPQSLYNRNFAICQYMSTHLGLPFATTDTRSWNDKVVGHFFPKQSTTSWNSGAVPCLTDAQFVEWTSVGIIDGGAITWGTPVVRANLANSPILTLQPYALAQLELLDAHLGEFQYPGAPNWRRAETPLPEATSEVAYSHSLTDGVDFWDPSGARITGLNLIGQPSWLSVAESSPGSGVWVLSGTPSETKATNYSFDLRIMAGSVGTLRTVQLKVNESPIMPTTSRTINGGAVWLDSGLELTYNNNGTASDSRAISYSSQSFQASGGFKLTAYYKTNSIGNTGGHNFSFGLISTDTDLSTYAGFNPFAADTSVYSLGVNLTTNQGASARGLNFTNGSSRTTLDTAGTNAQFVLGASTPIVIDIGPSGAWSYSINGIVEASGVIPGGFDSSKSYRVVVYGQDDNGGGKSIQSLALERKGLVAQWALEDGSGALVADTSGNNFHGTLANGNWTTGVVGRALAFNGIDSSVSIPAEAFASVKNEITIAMWVYGGTTQPVADTAFHAIDSSGNRVLNIHLPWSNSKVFWDAGNSGGTAYDRISKSATTSEFKGRWNHWVFTKSATNGEMKIYLNGSLWHSANGMSKSMGGIAKAFLGSSFGGFSYEGKIDQVRLYNIALSPSEVSELYGQYKGLEAWMSRYPGLADTGLSSDSDHDGIDLLLEYVLNGSPLNSDSLILPTVDSSSGNFVFKFTRLAESADDTGLLFQYSTNLTDWHDLEITGETASEVNIDAEVGGCQKITVTIGSDKAVDGRLFGRLKAVHP